MRARETNIWRDADIVLYPSDEEAEVVRALAPSVVVRSVVPYAFGDSEVDPLGSGSAGEAVDLVRRGLWPSAQRRRRRVVRAGSHARDRGSCAGGAAGHCRLEPVRVRRSRCAVTNVTSSANVSDTELLGWYRRARVAVVPLLSGAGVKLKTVEALWHGVPAV